MTGFPAGFVPWPGRLDVGFATAHGSFVWLRNGKARRYSSAAQADGELHQRKAMNFGGCCSATDVRWRFIVRRR
tara:strand:+ start:114 stop:335 length:222 start_codon:yes stop_codon:yes gene_type:complete